MALARQFAVCAVCLGSILLSPLLARAEKQPVSYLLDLREPASHLVRVTMTVPGTPPGVQIQFPAWNSLYQIRDFVRNAQQLSATCDGRQFLLSRLDLYTWQGDPQRCAMLEVRYSVYANEESVFSSVLNPQHAFLNFALLLFYLPQDRGRDVRVKFLLPPGWRLATLLEDADTPGQFKAPDYDTLTDSPAEAGEFQEYWYAQPELRETPGRDAARYRVVVFGDPADYSLEHLLASLRKITDTATALMRDVPFTRYTFIFHFPRGRGGGGMEHRNGTAISFPAASLSNRWESFEATVAHEFFHLWNVKRFRPQSLEPVDYIHGNDTRDLWFCEGVTSTYQDLILIRAGLISRERFYERLAAEIQALQTRPARLSQSVEQAGIEAWLERYPDYLRPERSISYYNKGALLGLLLDLAIRHATENRRSLDDVMRYLNEEYARRGRFFTQADLRAVIAKLAPEFTGLDGFLQDYLHGTRELDYDTYLGYAGLGLVTQSSEQPALGFRAVQSFDGPVQVESVEPNSNAEKAGLQRGDILLSMDGEPLNELPEAQLGKKKLGETAKLQVRRGRRVWELELALGARQDTTYHVEEIPNATEEQLEVRQGWLKGTSTRDLSPASR